MNIGSRSTFRETVILVETLWDPIFPQQEGTQRHNALCLLLRLRDVLGNLDGFFAFYHRRPLYLARVRQEHRMTSDQFGRRVLGTDDRPSKEIIGLNRFGGSDMYWIRLSIVHFRAPFRMCWTLFKGNMRRSCYDLAQRFEEISSCIGFGWCSPLHLVGFQEMSIFIG